MNGYNNGIIPYSVNDSNDAKVDGTVFNPANNSKCAN